MKALPLMASLMLCTLVVGATGCGARQESRAMGDVARPEEVLDFATLYSQNCAACHGEKEPTARHLAGEPGVPGDCRGRQHSTHYRRGLNVPMMPGFAKSAGGMLSDKQIAAITQGMIDAWANPLRSPVQTPPAYAGSSSGDASQGQQTLSAFCAVVTAPMQLALNPRICAPVHSSIVVSVAHQRSRPAQLHHRRPAGAGHARLALARVCERRPCTHRPRDRRHRGVDRHASHCNTGAGLPQNRDLNQRRNA